MRWTNCHCITSAILFIACTICVATRLQMTSYTIIHDHPLTIYNRYLVFGQMLESQNQYSIQNISIHSLHHPAFYYQIAAKYAIERKRSAEAASHVSSPVDSELRIDVHRTSRRRKLSSSCRAAGRVVRSLCLVKGWSTQNSRMSDNRMIITENASRRSSRRRWDFDEISLGFRVMTSSQELEKVEKENPFWVDIAREMLIHHSNEILDLLHRVRKMMSSTTRRNSDVWTSPIVSSRCDTFESRIFVPHGWVTCTQAYDYYKFKANRMALNIALLIGQERYASEKYDVAKKWDHVIEIIILTRCRWFDRIAANYRTEKWFVLLCDTLVHCLQCARKLNMANDFVNYSLQLLSTGTWPYAFYL